MLLTKVKKFVQGEGFVDEESNQKAENFVDDLLHINNAGDEI